MVYEEVLSKLPEFRLDPERPAGFACGQNLGVSSLNLVWD
jgi:hypothetical protein